MGRGIWYERGYNPATQQASEGVDRRQVRRSKNQHREFIWLGFQIYELDTSEGALHVKDVPREDLGFLRKTGKEERRRNKTEVGLRKTNEEKTWLGFDVQRIMI